MRKLKRKKIQIAYNSLKTGDVVSCGGVGIFSYAIRLFTSGWKKRHKSREVSTHTGLIIELGGQKFIAEMLSNGLNINSLNKYLKNKRKTILSISRPEDLNSAGRNVITHKIAYDYRKGLEYDWKGDIAFLLKKVKDNPEKAFCSEYTAYILKTYGGVFITEEFSSISPTEFQVPSISAPTLVPIMWEK